MEDNDSVLTLRAFLVCAIRRAYGRVSRESVSEVTGSVFTKLSRSPCSGSPQDPEDLAIRYSLSQKLPISSCLERTCLRISHRDANDDNHVSEWNRDL